jgi:hypothetical protein
MSTRNQRKYALNHAGAIDRIEALEDTLRQVRELAGAWADPHVGDQIIALIDAS